MARKPNTPAASIHEALRRHFAPPEFAYLSEVRNGTGYGRATTRTADALAFSLWPSRGLELHGVEIKSARHDWLREKDNPEKADEIGKYCDRWWLATGNPSIAEVGELPAPWGLLVFTDGAMKVVKVAEKLEAKPIDRLLLAAILRRSAEGCADHVHRDEVESTASALIDAAREEGAKAALYEHEREKVYHEQLKQQIADFERVSGVHIDNWTGRNIGAAVRAVANKTPAELRRSFEYIRNHASRLTKDVDEVLAALPALADEET